MKKILEPFLVWLLSMSVIQAKIINVPANQSTIQAGIDATINGDTVLVDPGVYVENINLNGKNIVVGSLFLTTGDTSYISKTVIDGNKRNSVVIFEKGEDSTTVLFGFIITNGQGVDASPTGAWPYNYFGGGITCRNNSNPKLRNLRVIGNTAPFGAGICIRESKPELENMIVCNNKADNMGGGIICYYNSNPIFKDMTITGNTTIGSGGGISCGINSNATFKNVIIAENIANTGGGIYCENQSKSNLEKVTIFHNTAFTKGGGIYGYEAELFCDNSNHSNIYLNYGGMGSDLCFENSSPISVIVDTFTVLNPSKDLASPLSSYTFNILHGKIQQVEHDLYVSPNGNDNNSGQSSSDPLHSISFALSKIKADSLNPHNIYLAEGIYKSSMGEHFPLNMHEYVSLSGASESNVILDAEGQGSVMCFNSDQGIKVENLSITGGSSQYSGGGINCNSSNPILKNLTLNKNTTVNYGGGIYCSNSSPILNNVTINENTSSWGGGGIFCVENSSPILESVTISRNNAKYWGGAVCSEDNSYPTLANSILWNNLPQETMGTVTIEYSDIKGGSEGIGNIDANPLFCDPLHGTYSIAKNSPCKGTGKNGFNMGALNVGCDSIFLNENPSVLYVSVSGSDGLGSGSYDNPFATIQHAFDVASSGDTIIVYPGTYHGNVSLAKRGIVLGSLFITTGDTSYISKTIMNGDSSGSVITISSGDSTTVISGFTITNGKGDEGGGINVYNANPTFSNIRIIGNRSSNGGGLNAESSNFKLINSVIANNKSTGFGGGIHADNSYPVLSNVVVKENICEGTGGGFYFTSSTPKLINVTIAENVAYYNGGGIELAFSWAVFDSVNRCNIYLNHAARGSDIDYFDFEEGNSNVVLFADTFTVKNPTDYHLYRIDKFNILHGKINQSNKDLYVNPVGSNNNSGESLSEPLRTISLALSKIEADSTHQRTIFISEGVYSSSKTGEHFPLNMVDYVSLKGVDSNNVILDAEKRSGVLSFDSDMGNYVESLTITEGMRYEGGGIWCANSSPKLIKVAITGNKAMNGGGGMNCSENSHPDLENCTISNNEAALGGGIAFYGSCASLLNTILWGNSPDEIYFQGLGYPRSCVAISYTDVMDSTKRIITNNNGDVYWREGNLNSNPLFCNSDSGHYSLAENSPCVGTGENGKNIGALSVGCGTMDVKNKQVGLPIKFELYQNYPNPFNPNTTIEYEIPRSGYVEVNIFDIRGRLIRSFDKSQQQAGIHRIVWDGQGNGGTIVASGTYFCRIHFNGNLLTKKLALIK